MKNQTILTPFHLDEPLPELECLAAPGWVINKPDLPEGEKQHRLTAIHRILADFAGNSIKMDDDGRTRTVCMGLLDTLVKNQDE